VALVTMQVARRPDIDPWGEALGTGIDAGLERGAEIIQADAEESLALSRDPWGETFEPLSPTTQRIYGLLREVRDTSSPIEVTRKGERSYAAAVRGRRWYLGFKQWGNPNNRMYDNARPAPIPPRPFLPIRDGGQVDIPRDVNDAILAAITSAVREAIARDIGRGVSATRSQRRR
jgi:hypothetical protein